MQDPQSVLLVEDNLDDVRLIQEALRAVTTARFFIDRVDRLSSAVEWLRRRSPGVILLDLNLPDSRGLDTLVVLRTHVPRTAIVVLTVRPEDEGPRAIRAGAQDFLTKSEFDGELLARSLHYSIERQALLNELQRRHVRELHERDREALGTWGAATELSDGQMTRGGFTLRQTSGELFRSLVGRYADILQGVIEREEAGGASRFVDQIDGIARRLGVLSASPADAMELHAVALELKARVRSSSDIEALHRQAGGVLIELLSALADHYRRYAVDLRQIHA